MNKGKVVSCIDLKSKRGAEFGPLNRPCISRDESEIYYIDHLDTAALREKFRPDPLVDENSLVSIDFVWDGQDLAATMREVLPLGYVVASHVIEHVPDLIGWLREVGELLGPDGILSLVIPDKRRTFDLLRQESTPADAIGSFVTQSKRPTPRQIFDHFYFHVQAHGAVNFPVPPKASELTTPFSAFDAYDLAVRTYAEQSYMDTHCWVFSPQSFFSILHVAFDLGLLPYKVADFYDTADGEIEFHVSLRKLNSSGDFPRQRQLNSIPAAYRRGIIPDSSLPQDAIIADAPAPAEPAALPKPADAIDETVPESRISITQRLRTILAAPRIQAARAGAEPPPPAFTGGSHATITVPTAQPWLDGFLDRAEIERIGFVRLIGWSHVQTINLAIPAVTLNGQLLRSHKTYRFHRPDVPAVPGQLMRQTGVIMEYRLPAALMLGESDLAVLTINGQSHRIGARLAPITPHYDSLLDTSQVLQREHIYGVGPPAPDVSPAVLALLDAIEGPVLDFGCGSGALVRALRARGLEAHGLEIDRPEIRDSLQDDVRPFITLYEGRLPGPYESGSFATVISTEVLEHIPDHRAALAEMARLSRNALIITVPDAEAIPRGFPHHVVPWHLLEASHLNFFTQRSLEAVLRPHFAQIDFGRIGSFRINDSDIHESLVAVCVR